MDVTIGNATINVKPDLSGMENLHALIEPHMARAMRTVGIAMTAVGGSIVAGLGASVMKAADFSKALGELNTLGIADLGKLEAAVKSVAMEYGLGLTDSVKAAYQAISAGVSEMDTPMLLAQAARAATAGISDLTTAIDLATNVTNAFGLTTRDAQQVYDEAFIAVKLGKTTFDELAGSVGRLAPIFNSAGLSSADMFGSIAALTTGGIQTSEAVSGMKMAISAIIAPSKEASTVAKALEIDFNAAGLRAKGLEGFLNEVGAAIRARGPELAAHRAELEQVIDGWDSSAESNKQAAAAIKEQVAELTRQRDEMRAVGADTRALDDQIRALKDQQADYTSASRNTREGLKGLKEEFKSLEGVSDDQLTTMAALFGGIEGLNAVLALTGGQAGKFGQIMNELTTATGATDAAFEAFVSANPAYAFDLLKAALERVSVEIGQALLPALTEAARAIIPIVAGIAEWVGAHPELMKVLIPLIGACGGLALVLGPILMVLPGIVTAMELVGGAFTVVLAIFAGAAAPVAIAVGAIALLIPIVAEVIEHWDYLWAFFKGFWEGLYEVVKAWVKVIIDVVKWLGEQIGNIFGGIWDAFGSVAELMGFAGGGVVGYARGGVIGVPSFAEGGRVGQDWRMAMVGEQGPELAAFPVGTRIMSNREMRDSVGGGQSLTIGTINVADRADADYLLRELTRMFEGRRSGRGLSTLMALGA